MLTFRPTLVVAAICIALSCAANHSARTDEQLIKIVVLGDSLTAGSGISTGYRFTDQLEFALRAKGHSVAVVNAGVGGDTAARGLARFEPISAR